MTEKEIVQALRCCTDHSCSFKCPAYQAGLDCREEMHKAVLNLVENLTTENADMRKEVAELREKVPQWISVEDASIKLAAQALETTPDELRGMAKARKDGRLAILPTARGDMLTSEEVSAVQPFFDDVDVSVHYCTSNGMMIFVGYDAFRDWVKNWEIAAANKEAERALEGQKND